MPIYEYICDDCGKHFEQIVLSRSQEIACPGCSSRRHTLQLSVFSAPGNASGTTASMNGRAAMPGGSCACGTGGCGRN